MTVGPELLRDSSHLHTASFSTGKHLQDLNNISNHLQLRFGDQNKTHESRFFSQSDFVTTGGSRKPNWAGSLRRDEAPPAEQDHLWRDEAPPGPGRVNEERRASLLRPLVCRRSAMGSWGCGAVGAVGL